MLSYVLSEIAGAMGGAIVHGDPGQPANSVIIDSRSARPGALFFALPGERADGHSFVGQAAAGGAVGAVVSKARGAEAGAAGPQESGKSWGSLQLPPDFGLIAVPDTLVALGDLASFHRSHITARVIGVTGSAGKTTTKDVIASVLSAAHRVAATPGNMNNEIGMPLTILGIDAVHDAAVVEMAMRAHGQITALARIARPDIGVVTNVGDAHIELLGSRESIARAKAELVEALPDNGIAVLNGDDPLVKAMAVLARGTAITYGLGDDCVVRADNIEPSPSGTAFTLVIEGRPLEGVRFTVPLPGRHNVMNALAALAVGWNLGMSAQDMARGLANFVPSAMRMQFLPAPGGYTIIDDTYNANPASIMAAMDAAVEYAAGRRVIAVIGDMLELGDRSPEAHAEVGAHAHRAGVAALVSVGAMSAAAAQAARHASESDGARAPVAASARTARSEGLAGTGVGDAAQAKMEYTEECADTLAAALAVKRIVRKGDVVLVKGSRGMRMETVVNALMRRPEKSGERSL